jgi:hypothetical protein
MRIYFTYVLDCSGATNLIRLWNILQTLTHVYNSESHKVYDGGFKVNCRWLEWFINFLYHSLSVQSFFASKKLRAITKSMTRCITHFFLIGSIIRISRADVVLLPCSYNYKIESACRPRLDLDRLSAVHRWRAVCICHSCFLSTSPQFTIVLGFILNSLDAFSEEPEISTSTRIMVLHVRAGFSSSHVTLQLT